MNELVSASDERKRSAFVHLRGGLRGALRAIFDVALPPLCPSCREPLAGGAGLCAACWSKLSLIEPPYCARLGIPFTYDPGPGLLSMEAIANPPSYDRARAAVRYDDVARALVHRFKYGDRLDLAPMMGGWMARAGRELLDGADAFVPVPLHWRRLWARRFNQSARLPAPSRRRSGGRCCTAPCSGCGRHRNRSASTRTSARRTCRAPSRSMPGARLTSPASGWCSSTMC